MGSTATAYVAYYRVSTQRQGQSGLGLDAQRAAVSHYINGGQLVAEYTEVESGKRAVNRPQLQAALEDCKRRSAVLLIAKLDRLARNVHFVSGLMEAGVEFIAADMPFANKLTVHIMAAMAEWEREQISQRTKVALAEAKRRGVRLGNPRLDDARELSRTAAREAPATLAPELLALMVEKQQAGKSLRAIARCLNNLQVKTPRNRRWHAQSVKDQLERIVPSQ